MVKSAVAHSTRVLSEAVRTGEGDSALHDPPSGLLPRGRSRPLVLGIIPSLTWSVTRCLSRAGHKPVVLGWHRVSPLQLLPDCDYVPLSNVRWINGELDPTLLDQVDAACARFQIDLVMGIDFPGVLLLARHGARLRHRIAPMPEPALMLELHNKWHFSNVLRGLDIPQPMTELARSADELLATRIGFPIITKPIDRWASVGFQIHDSREALQATILRRGLAAPFPLLVQDYVPGNDVGFAFLADRGKLLAHAAFDNPRRGVRRYFRSEVLRHHVERFLRATGYHGLGEIDTRYHIARDEYRLLEINPRCWASILYAQHAGMNFPDLLIQLAQRERRNSDFAATAQPVRLSYYELGVSKLMQFAERAHAYRLSRAR